MKINQGKFLRTKTKRQAKRKTKTKAGAFDNFLRKKNPSGLKSKKNRKNQATLRKLNLKKIKSKFSRQNNNKRPTGKNKKRFSRRLKKCLRIILYIILFFVGALFVSETTVFLLQKETNHHWQKLNNLSQQADFLKDILNKETSAFPGKTLSVSEKKKILQQVRELDEIALEMDYAGRAFHDDLSVLLWLGERSPLPLAFWEARKSPAYIHSLTSALNTFLLVKNPALLEKELLQKKFELLQQNLKKTQNLLNDYL